MCISQSTWKMSTRCIQGFKVLPICFASDSSSHELFIREHSVRNYDVNKPPGKTLFLINVPPYASEDSLKKIFSVVGKVKSVTLQRTVAEGTNENKSKCGFKVGYVVFEKREELLKSLKLEHIKSLSSNEEPIQIGLSKWIHEYNMSIYDHEKLTEEVKTYVKISEKDEKGKKMHEKQGVDEEGWTVVTKKGRNPGISRKESVENKIIQKNKIKSKKKELKNFYTFQLKEEKMKNIIALRKSFQDSKEKVNVMKNLRNFKPF